MRFFTTVLALFLPSLVLAGNPPVTWNASCASGIYNIPMQACLSSGGGSGSPGGSDTQVQFNSSGDFGGSSGLTWASNLLSATNLSLPYSTGSSVGVLKMGSDSWMHAFAHSGTNGYNTFLGSGAGNFTFTGSVSGIDGSYNTAVGGVTGSALTTGRYNSFFGILSGNAATTAVNLTCMGNNACGAATSASNSVSIGGSSGQSFTTNGDETFVGYGAGDFHTAGGASCFGLRSCKFATSAARISSFGEYAATNSDTGDDIVALGAYSFYNNISGKNGVAVGNYACYNSLADNNICIGKGDTTAAHGPTSGSGNVWIGNDLYYSAGTVSNTLDIGNALFCTGLSSGNTLASAACGVGIAAPNYTWDVIGTGHYSGALTVGGTTTLNLGAGITRSSAGGVISAAEISGDCTTSGSNAITCTKTGGVSLGTAAVQNVGAFAQVANNLSDVTASTARTNLGLGTAATAASTAFYQVAAATTATQAGASSAPALTFSGAPFVGSATTSKAHTLWEWGSPTTNNWGTVGNVLGINEASGGTVNFLNFQVNGVQTMVANSLGGLTLHNTGDNLYTGSLCEIGQVNSTSATFCHYVNSSQWLLFNQALNSASFGMNYQGLVIMGQAAFGHPNAQVLSQVRDVTWPSYASKRLTSQTGYGYAHYDTDEATIIAGIDPNGHFVARGLSANGQSATVNANAGTGATCTIANASDVAGVVTLTTTAVSPASGAQCAINFGSAYATAPVCQFTPASSAAVLNEIASGIYLTSSTSALTFNFANSDVTGHTYVLNYYCVQTK